MQLKMQDILGFTSFYDTVKSQKLTMKTAYKLAQLARAVDGELQFYREKLQAIIGEYGMLDDNGQPVPTEDGDGIKLRPGAEEACYLAMRELQNIEVTLPDIIFSINDFDGIELTIADMGAMLPFLVD
jgi:hypothetical protein